MEDEHGQEGGGHGAGHDVHLPDPSPWPIVAGVASLFLGAALVWWARDTGNEIAAVALGAAAVIALFAVGGWSYEDGKMRAKAASHEEHTDANARFTQVLTFAIPEGQLEAARAGLIAQINSRGDSLRDLAGFQDLRIVVSPSETGTSQALVETTWSNREGLATYDEGRDTLLDLINNHTDQVVAGTVQVFDMEVVRDTKDVAVRFGKGTAATLIGSLIIGGFFVGAGLTLFEGEATAGEGGGNGGSPTGFAQTGEIRAVDTAFPETELMLPPDAEVTVTFNNVGQQPHNWHVFPEGVSPAADAEFLQGCTAGCLDGGTGVATETLLGGDAPVQLTFTTPSPGSYEFYCSVHPNQMRGVLVIEEGVPVPGASAAPPTEGEGGEGDAEGDAEEGSDS